MGTAEIVRKCKTLLSQMDNNVGSITGSCSEDLTKIIYNLLSHAVKGKMRKDQALNILSDISVLHIEIAPLILDVFNVVDAETSSLDPTSEERLNFAFLIKNSDKFLSDRLIKERLDVDTLQEVKILACKNFQAKFVRIKTKLYYKQKKFNLYREECEGYAKLLTELNQDTRNTTVEYTLEVIKSLIGCFNLDPNRVLSAMLDSFECHIDEPDFYIPLIKSYMPQSKVLSEVLAFKYTWYQNASEVTPKSLYSVTAIMLQHKVISLDDIYCWLSPDDKVIIKDWHVEFIEVKIPYRYGAVNNIVSMTNQVEVQELDQETDEEEVKDKHERNQKFGLIVALLNIGDWHTCQEIFKKLPQDYLMAYPPISYSLCQLLHPLIEPVYRKHCRLGPKLKGRVVEPLTNLLAVKPAETFLQLRDEVFPMLHTLGPFLGCDVVLLYKIMRIVKRSLELSGVVEHGSPPTEDSLYYDVITLFDLAFLPTLSSLEDNCCVAEELWELIKLYPYNTRYCLYGRWKNDTIGKYPHLSYYNASVQKKARDIMKRISKEASKAFGRLLGKLTHFSPGSLFDYLLCQILQYDNLIPPLVDSFKYLGSMSYDILAYCIIELLVTPGRTQTKYTDLTLSTWLVNLALFAGHVYKKYNIELMGILQYICNQLKSEQSFELLFLNELVQKMVGIDISDEMTDEQLLAFAGGDCLKAEAGYFNHIRNTKKSSQRLKEALLHHDLAFSLCFLIAQQKICIMFKDPGSVAIKLVGKLTDSCQNTLVNYGTFLGSALSIDEYDKRLPSIRDMIESFHIEPAVAFFLARPMISNGINAKYDFLRKTETNFKKLPTATKLHIYCHAASQFINPISEEIRDLYPKKIWEDMSPQFMVLFWSLNLYDIFVPVSSYTREINKLKQQASAVYDSKDMPQSKMKKEAERCNSLIEKLQDEHKKHVEHTERVTFRLREDKETWFVSKTPKLTKNETITQFLQNCLFPRCIFTMVDALFCAKFVYSLHILKTPNFSTLLCYDRLFCDIVSSVTLCTENEARRYGRFLCEVLETVMRWHSDEAIFEKECSLYPGFVTKYRVSNQFSEASKHVGYENYRHVCHKWHYKITKALVVCLDSKDFIQTRNALIILIKILPHFPVLAKLAQIIEKKVEKVRDEEKGRRPDLYTLALSYCGLLKNNTPKFVKEADFHHVVSVQKDEDVESNSATMDNVKTSVSPKNNLNHADENVVEDHKHGLKSNVDGESNIILSKEKHKGKPVIVDPNVIHIEDMDRRMSDFKRHREESIERERDYKREALESDKPYKRKERKDDGEKRSKDKIREEKFYEEKPHRDDRHSMQVLSRDEKEKVRTYYHSSAYEDEEIRPAMPSSRPSMPSSRPGASSSHIPTISRHRESDVIDKELRRKKGEAGSSSTKQSSKHRSSSLSPDSQFVVAKKERRKTKKTVRESTPPPPPPVLDSKITLRKRVGSDEIIVVAESKRRKSEEKPLKPSFHQNGSDPIIKSTVVHSDKYHRSVPLDPVFYHPSRDVPSRGEKHRRSELKNR